jgi:putative ABC transport system permease protein
VDSPARDVRYGLRTFSRRPGTTAIILLLITLGTTLSTAVFSVGKAALLYGVPGNFDRLVIVSEAHPRRGANAACRPANFLDWKAENHVFESATSVWSGRMDLSGREETERVDVSIVLEDYFDVLGVPALAGRTFEKEDHEDAVGDPSAWDAVSGVAVLSYPFWQRRFGGDPDVLGETLTLNGHAFTVVGIMPRSFQGLGGSPELWVPGVPPPEIRHDRESHLLFGFATLKEGVSIERARAELGTIYRRLESRFPESNRDWTSEVRPFRDVLLGDSKTGILLLFGGALVVMAIACVNVAGLLVGVAQGRETEVSIRRALGASRSRLVRQFLTESLLLAGTGGLLSLGCAAALEPVVAVLNVPTALPFELTPRFDPAVLLFAVLLASVTGIASGLAPALSTSSRPSAFPRSRWRAGALITGETALAMALLVAGGLVLRSYLDLERRDPGFAPQNLLTMEVALPRAEQDDPAAATAFQESLLENVLAIPGVRSAATATFAPLSPRTLNLRFRIENRPTESDDDFSAAANIVSDGYFRTIGAALVSGRGFESDDSRGGEGVVVVSESLAREYFEGESPLGVRLFFPYPDMGGRPFTIVGIVGDVTHERLEAETKRAVYILHRQQPLGDAVLIVRTDDDPEPYAPLIVRRIHGVNPSLAVSRIATMQEIGERSLRGPRLNTSLLVLFAALALVLSASGLYGVLAFAVSRRTREIGIRMALGADARSIARLVARHGLSFTLLGIALGGALALATARLFAAVLYGVSPADPAALGGSAGIVLLVSVVAAQLPARRASSLAPSTALRRDHL